MGDRCLVESIDKLGGFISEEKWVAGVKTKWSPPEDFFKQSAGKIASGLMSASSDLSQAMGRLNFYINRAGKNLSDDDRKRLESAKKKLSAMNKEDLDESKKVTSAQISKAAQRVVDEARWERELTKLGVDVSKWDRGYMSYYVAPIITAILNAQGIDVDSVARTQARAMLKTVLTTMSPAAKTEDDDDSGDGVSLDELLSEVDLEAKDEDEVTEAYEYKNKYVGKNARLKYDRTNYFLEELHQKGKRKLRVAEWNIPPFLHSESAMLSLNIINYAKLRPTDTYDVIKGKIAKSIRDGYKILIKSPKWQEYAEKEKKWFGKEDWKEKQVSALKVTPEGVEPLKIFGDGFVLNSEWDEFEAYSPDSDMQSHDPSFSKIHEKSAGGARKLYKIVKADPGALRRVSFGDFAKWLDKKKIGYEWTHSVWR